jgi:hypothetical protein
VDYGQRPSDSQPDKIRGRFPRGVRHSTLKRRAHQVVQTVDSSDELAARKVVDRLMQIAMLGSRSMVALPGIAKDAVAYASYY